MNIVVDKRVLNLEAVVDGELCFKAEFAQVDDLAVEISTSTRGDIDKEVFACALVLIAETMMPPALKAKALVIAETLMELAKSKNGRDEIPF